jgi:putative nucleotidyltransferase with HDIG domain
MTRLRTRAFLICFVPLAILLAASFWMIQRYMESAVGAGVRLSLRENQFAIAQIHARADFENNRFLRVAGENSDLKAGIGLLRSSPGSDGARRTVEDQLRELGEHMGFDFLVISAPNGTPLAAVIRNATDDSAGKGQLEPVPSTLAKGLTSGLAQFDGRTFQVASVPIDQDDENLGSLSVGEFFGFSEFTTPAVLQHNGKVIESNLNGVPFGELDAALARCSDQSECDLRLRGSNWVSLPVQAYGGGYLLRSLENVDRATAPIASRLHRLFLSMAAAAVLLALLCSLLASRTIVKPIAAVVSHLRNAVRTGVLPEFAGRPSSIFEIRQLEEIYNRAALSVKVAGEDLEAAYLEFIGSLANALDARDRYTSGHSLRVSRLSQAVAAAMNLDARDQERIRVGALLHDIGKIGIADNVLQKEGRLSDEEFEIVKQHPVIGRRILEGVRGLSPFIPAVELHHENWDGSGYPKRQKGKETPIDARIVHVSDAYDAMTTDRSYRKGMTHERAVEILKEYAGTQFDPQIVEVFAALPCEVITRPASEKEAPRIAVVPAMAVAG